MKTSGAIGDRFLVIREYSATVGATDGNIIAAIITSQIAEEPAERSEVGARPVVHAAHAVDREPPRERRRARTAARSSAEPSARGRDRPAVSPAADAVTRSGGPGELRRR